VIVKLTPLNRNQCKLFKRTNILNPNEIILNPLSLKNLRLAFSTSKNHFLNKKTTKDENNNINILKTIIYCFASLI
jgi:hypothetical protein